MAAREFTFVLLIFDLQSNAPRRKKTLTFDMSGSWRLADSCPLDGGVMPHTGPAAQGQLQRQGQIFLGAKR